MSPTMILLMFIALLLAGCSSEQDKLLIHAAGKGEVNAARELLREGANPNATALDDWTPLTRASIEGHSDVIALLLEKGAEVNKSMGDITPLYLAVSRGHIASTKLLLRHGGRLNIPKENRESFMERLRQHNSRELEDLIRDQL